MTLLVELNLQAPDHIFIVSEIKKPFYVTFMTLSFKSPAQINGLFSIE